MSEITAQMVRELREVTGLGMMECKKALVESGGDSKKAEEVLRVRSGIKAGKAASRTAAEGVVAIVESSDGKNATIIEINCETDFVAKDQNFINFVELVKKVVADKKPTTLEQLAAITV